MRWKNVSHLTVSFCFQGINQYRQALLTTTVFIGMMFRYIGMLKTFGYRRVLMSVLVSFMINNNERNYELCRN